MKVKEILEPLIKRENRTTYKVRLEDGMGIWKQGDTNSHNELRAYLVSQYLGLEMVPATELCGDGHLQRFIKGERLEKYNGEFPLAELQKLAVFDLAININDRWQGNYLIDKNGKVWAHDNGDSFHGYQCLSPSITFLLCPWLEETKLWVKWILSKDYTVLINDASTQHAIDYNLKVLEGGLNGQQNPGTDRQISYRKMWT